MPQGLQDPLEQHQQFLVQQDLLVILALQDQQVRLVQHLLCLDQLDLRVQQEPLVLRDLLVQRVLLDRLVRQVLQVPQDQRVQLVLLVLRALQGPQAHQILQW